MSWVTNVIITAALANTEYAPRDGDEYLPAIKAINDELGKQGRGAFSRVEATASRNALETTVHVGAFNYLSREEVLAIVRAAPWELPWTVQIFIQEQEEDCFSMHRIDDDDERADNAQ